MFLNETWITTKSCVNLEIPGYNCVHLYGNKSHNVNRGRSSGGLAIYYKQHLSKYIEVVEKIQNGIMWTKLSKDLFYFDENVFIGNMYIPPPGSTVINNRVFDFFEQLELGIEKYKSRGKCFIIGDLNSRTSNLKDFLEIDENVDDDFLLQKNANLKQRVSKDKIIDNYGKRLLETCCTTSFVIANGRICKDKNNGDFTFYSTNGCSVVDYLLLNPEDIEHIKTFEIEPLSEFSDHCSLYFSFNNKLTNVENKGNNNVNDELYVKFDENKLEDFVSLLRQKQNEFQTCVENVEIITDINDITNNFITVLKDCTQSIFGKNRNTKRRPNDIYKSNKKPWFTDDCYNARKQFNYARNRFQRNKDNITLRQAFLTAKTSYRKIKNACKRAYLTREKRNLVTLGKTKPREFWKKIKSQFKKQTQKSSSLNINDLFDHFKELYSNTDEPPDDNHNPINHYNANDDDLDCPITLSELKTAVFSQNNNKACGLDQISSEIYKHAFNEISPFLLKFFNRLFERGEYPSCFGEGIIYPIFKGGNIDDPKNYRGITLINIISKIFSQIILNRFTKWSAKNETLIDNQFGFQKGKSTIDCIFILHSIIAKTLNSNKKLYCAFVDFEKCFDKINRGYLFKKLMNSNVSTKFINVVKSMYSVVKACVRHNSEYSPFFNSNIGVKQGDQCSSLLFLFFVNDILSNLNDNVDDLFSINGLKLFILLFADDAVLFAHSPQALQSLLTDLHRYCTTWNLKVNTSKTKIMIFEKRGNTQFDFKYDNIILDIVNNFKYLGVTLYKNGKWSQTEKTVAQRSQAALHNLFIVFNQIDLTTKDKCNLFDSLVGSVLNYGAEIFGYNDCKTIEKIHCKFLRKVLCVKTSTNLDGLYGEIGRFPMIIQRKILMLKYWIKIIKTQNSSLIKRTYNLLRNDADNNIHYNKLNWAYQIKQILQEIGMLNIWYNQDNHTIKINIIKQRITDIYQQTWQNNIIHSNRLDSYKLFKHTISIEDYLNYIDINKFRIILTRFRLSSHDLFIEIGRHQNIPRNDRICQHCNMNMIENEYHFLLVCPKYKTLRIKYFTPYFCHWPTLQKFKTLMSLNSPLKIINLAKYLYFAFKLRSQIN